MTAALSVTENERWMPAPGLEGRYEVSNMGRARHVSGRLRRLKARGGYSFLAVKTDGKTRNHSMARLVCEAFNGPPPTSGLDCDHINRIRNDDRPGNLRWVTRSVNLKNRICAFGEDHHHSKLDADAVRFVRASEADSFALAPLFNVSPRAIRDARNRVTWRHVA